MNNKLSKEDIVFDDMVYYDSDEEISVYLSQNTKLNEIAKTNFPISDSYQTNFYGVYNYNTGTFKVVSITSLYISETEIKEDLPNIADEVIEMSKKNESLLDLTSSELDLIYDIFTDYCKKELSYILSPENLDFKNFIQECERQLS